MRKLEAGSVVALNGVQPYGVDSGPLFGLYTLTEHEDMDRAAFVTESGWWITETAAMASLDRQAPEVFITDLDLWEQTDPKGYGRFVAEERACRLASEYEVLV